MLLYAICIFVSAFLLFQVQPMISRFILPFFGGTPMVWSTVQLFFQIFLTVGYAYSAWMISRVRVRNQRVIHITLLGVAVVALVTLGHFLALACDPLGCLETHQRGYSHPGYLQIIDCRGWPALFHALHQQPADPGLVQQGAPREKPLPVVRAFQHRLPAWAAGLSLPDRTQSDAAGARLGLDDRLCALRRTSRHRRLPFRSFYWFGGKSKPAPHSPPAR